MIETKNPLPEAPPAEQSPVPPMTQVSSLRLPGSFMKLPFPIQSSSFYACQEGVPPSLSPLQSMNEQGMQRSLPVYSQVSPWFNGPNSMGDGVILLDGSDV